MWLSLALRQVSQQVETSSLKCTPLHRWKIEKNNLIQSSIKPRISRINIEYKGYIKKGITLEMSKGISTPFDCTKHISQLLSDQSVIALVNDQPYDMHKPLYDDCELDFVHFKDMYHDPMLANRAFWRSCCILLGATLESSFREAFSVHILSLPPTPLESGSFVADIRVSCPLRDQEGLIVWRPSKLDLRALSSRAQEIALSGPEFEAMEAANSAQLASVLMDAARVRALQEVEPTSASKFQLYRMGQYVQALSEGPVIASTKFIGRFAVTSVRLLGRLSTSFGLREGEATQQLVYRVQGVAIPTTFLTHFTTFDLLMRRAELPNESVPESLAYIEPL